MITPSKWVAQWFVDGDANVTSWRAYPVRYWRTDAVEWTIPNDGEASGQTWTSA